MLHAPDFLGYESAVHMAADHREVVEQGLRLKRAGNAIVTLLGGREVHPINVRVGGFYRAPTMHELQTLVPELEWARDAAAETARWTAQLPMPDIEIDYDFVSLRHPDEYPFNEGRIVSTSGLDIAAEEWPEHFVEEHKERSNALHAYFRSGGMFKVGPLARFALNADRLTPLAANVVAELGLSMPCRNPFQSIVVRSIEMVFAAEEALRIISEYKRPPESFVPIEPGPGVGSAATEAPRGLLWHRYELDEAGRIAEARIVPPTSQNQAVIESDVRRVLGEHLHLDDEALTWRLEQTIRNYDPCISCATHFLKVEIDRA